MQRVKVNRLILLDKVKSNREAHAKNVADAMVVYRQEATNRLREMLRKAEDGGEIERHTGLPRARGLHGALRPGDRDAGDER